MNPYFLFARRTALSLALLIFVFAGASAQTSEYVRVTLLQVNDVYQFSPDRDDRGGLGRLLTIKRATQKENPNTLLLLAGDTISPAVESNFKTASMKQPYKGAQMIDAWNAAGLDYATFGNHEFDYGPDVLKERMKESKFGWIAANVIDTRTGKTFGGVPPYVIRTFDGVKIGIFGLVLPATKTSSRPGEFVVFRNPCQTARRMVATLRARGVKVIIALTHLSMGEDKEVARCANVNLIVGGHEHTLLESHAGIAPIFKMTANAREVGELKLNILRRTGELHSIDWKITPLTNATPTAPEFTALTQKYSEILTELDQPVGTTTVKLDARSAENRTRETNVGDLVADAFREATGADVALVNGGSIRADECLPIGKLTLRDVASILPFNGPMAKIEVSGATLRAALEHGVALSAENPEPGRFPQVSGIEFSFDASKPAGKRIVNVTVNGQPLDPAKNYTLATSDYVAKGGDEYAVLKGSRAVPLSGPLPTDTEALRRAISSAQTVSPQVKGRIKRLDAVRNAAPPCDETSP